MYALEQKAIWKPRELQFKEKTLRHFILAAFDFVPLKGMMLLLENKFFVLNTENVFSKVQMK